ncbi:hypothetical protein BGI41_04680 [Methanobrevibacter sp. 87.7]|uniref:hypothetical protein n=1 Tax=Methanobrevibacter sp. 87.7 TaxID=387957 RepID=UPI000B505117|nr:hypothetical protein [Methanobrevibacter sp. 87.7]OWT33004.1 hypothetical protein BGI41_04680 [Methanobrevibacter sp. 87.7]
MPLKTILLLINIAIICIIACIIVKLYYRDEEKERKLETHEIESSLKGHNEMPIFKEERHRKDNKHKINNTLSSTKNKIFKNKPEEKTTDNLNKEIEELTITRPKTNTKPKTTENKITQTTNANKTILKEKPKTNRPSGKPISINVKNSPDIKPKVVNAKTQEETAKSKLKTTATQPKVSKEEIKKIEEKPTKAAHNIIEPSKIEEKDVKPEEKPKVDFIKPEPKTHTSPKLRTEPKIIEEKPEPIENTEPTIIEEKPIKVETEEKPEPIEKEAKPFELKNSSTEAHISQEPIEAQHQNIINETRKISQAEINNVTIDDYDEPEKAKEFIDAPIKSVKGTFNSIKSTFLSHDKDKEEKDYASEIENNNTNDAVLEEILNEDNTDYSEDYYNDDNDDFVAITPLHDPEEIRKYEESLKNNYDREDVFNNINSETTELTPEEISYFDNLEEEFNDELNQNEKNRYVASKTDDMKITVGNKPKVKPVNNNRKMRPSERFHKEYQGNKVEPKKEETATNNKPSTNDDTIVNIQGVNYTLKRGMSIIYQHHGEKYGSSIHNVNGDNVNVTYRGKKIWIKTDKITKVF